MSTCPCLVTHCQLVLLLAWLQLYKFVNDPSVLATDLVLLTDWADVVLDASTISDIPAKFKAITNPVQQSSYSSGNSRCPGSSSSPSCTSPSGSNTSGGSSYVGEGSVNASLALVFAAEQYCW